MFAGDALPGFRVDIAPAPQAEALPRMDVALFAGFAERGPCHIAIALSSVAAYEAVFGGDCLLAWDEASGRQLTGNLAATVRAFFSNGGTRCWAIRLAETGPLAAVRAATQGSDPGSRPATWNSFALTGVLRRLPTAGNDATFMSPALLTAASLGSWSDSMRLAARVLRQPLAITGQAKVKFGLRFADTGTLAPGDLIEIVGGDGLVTRYAKVLRVGGGEVWALWIASFARIESATPVKTGLAAMPDLPGNFAAEFQEGRTCSVEVTDVVGAAALARGRWVHFHQPGESIWLRADRVADGVASGPAWQQVASRLPGGSLAAAKVTIDLAEHRPGGDRVHAGLGLAPEGANAIHSLVDADRFHADRANRSAAIRPGFAVDRAETAVIAAGMAGRGFAETVARFGTLAFTATDRIALRSAWLPIGIGASFPEAQGPLRSTADPLVRDGLSRFDERLFLDPRLAELRGPALTQRIAAIRDLSEQPLFGIHAGFDIAGDLFPEPSLFAVPDAAQPGWETAAPIDKVLPPRPGAPTRADWRTHAGGCPTGDDAALSGPDLGCFLDSSTRLLEAPELTAPTEPVAADGFTLSWDAQPAGAVVVLEESTQLDFAGAAELLRDKNVTQIKITGRAQGVHYYRLHIELDGNVSAYAAAAVVLRKARFAATSAEPARLARLHAAMLRMAGADGDFFALLSLPANFRTDEATAHANALATTAPGAGDAGRLGFDETRLLSFGALYHPWLVARTGIGLSSSPPDGAVAGTMAARAQLRGVWIAPANDPLRDVVGLDPSLPEGELLALDRARVNMIRRLPAGFALHDADTLCPEREWRPINVRRLMMMLRRTLLRRGMTYVFEPNGPVLRRAVERSLSETLNQLQQRGAFAGANSDQSFRIAVQADAADLDAGRITVEIGVAPSHPIRFLTLRLVQQGARLTILEEA